MCAIHQRCEDMDESELSEALARLRQGGLVEATGDGGKIGMRDRLKVLLQGGCGRSFSTQV
jgi:DNA-binding transcriptional ArsR family regulator